MMKFTLALTATAFAANAASLEHVSHAAEWVAKPSFSIGDSYKAPDYTSPYGETLPGADFNKQVYKFHEGKQIWDQNDYEERVKVEAEMLVALEALKSSTNTLGGTIHSLTDKISFNSTRIGANMNDVFMNMADNLEKMAMIGTEIASA